MTKYHVKELKLRTVAVQGIVSEEMAKTLKAKIMRLLVEKKKYKDKTYSAHRLAMDMGTNSRYVSIVFREQFGMNYATFVSKYRVAEAQTILSSEEYDSLRVEDVGEMVGFCSRQSFYAAFYRFLGLTPREYQQQERKRREMSIRKRENDTNEQ